MPFCCGKKAPGEPRLALASSHTANLELMQRTGALNQLGGFTLKTGLLENLKLGDNIPMKLGSNLEFCWKDGKWTREWRETARLQDETAAITAKNELLRRENEKLKFQKKTLLETLAATQLDENILSGIQASDPSGVHRGILDD